MKEKSPYVAEEEKYDDINYVRKELDNLTLAQLIERWDASWEHDGSGNLINEEDYWNCATAIRNRLNIARHDTINEALDVILKKIEHLEAKFRNHRHEKEKSFTAKPEW